MSERHPHAPLAIQHTKRNARLAVEAGERAAIDALGPMRTEIQASADFQKGVASSSSDAPRSSPDVDGARLARLALADQLAPSGD